MTQPRATAESRSDDARLAAAASGGQPGAPAQLIERLFDRIRTTTRYLATNDFDADELTQLACMEILSSCATFRGESSLETWADRIVVRTSMRWLRRWRWRLSIVRPDPAPEEHAPLSPTGEQGSGHLDLRRNLARILNALPPSRRLPLVLQIVYGYGVAEIASLCEVPVNTIRDRLRMGRLELRKRLQREPALCEALEGLKP